MWHTRSSTTVYENAWIRVREDQVDRPDGGAGIYGVDVSLPANGNWELRLAAEDGATDWQVVQRIFVK